MKDLVQNWLDNPLLSHVQACCIRLASGQCHTQVAGTELSAEDFEQAIGRIGAIVPLLVDQGLLPGQLTWNFAQGRLHYVVRSDRTALGLYCKPEAETDATAVTDFIAGFCDRA